MIRLLKNICLIIVHVLFYGSGLTSGKKLLWWHPVVIFMILFDLVIHIVAAFWSSLKTWFDNIQKEEFRSI